MATPFFGNPNAYSLGDTLSDTDVETLFNDLDTARASRTAVAVTVADVTLSAAQYETPVIEASGALTGNRSLIVPLVAGARWWVRNATSGAFSLTVIGATGTGIVVGQGFACLVWTDGTNVYRATPDVSQAGGLAASTVPAGVVGVTASTARLGGQLVTNVTAVGNVGAGEDSLMSYTLPASVLGTNGDRLEVTASGTFAANANAKQIKLKFGATAILATGALAINSGFWRLQATIIRTGATAQLASAVIFSDNALLVALAKGATPAETLSGTVALLFTGEATADNDIVQTALSVLWFPA